MHTKYFVLSKKRVFIIFLERERKVSREREREKENLFEKERIFFLQTEEREKERDS